MILLVFLLFLLYLIVFDTHTSRYRYTLEHITSQRSSTLTHTKSHFHTTALNYTATSLTSRLHLRYTHTQTHPPSPPATLMVLLLYTGPLPLVAAPTHGASTQCFWHLQHHIPIFNNPVNLLTYYLLTDDTVQHHSPPAMSLSTSLQPNPHPLLSQCDRRTASWLDSTTHRIKKIPATQVCIEIGLTCLGMVHCPCCDTDRCNWKWSRFLCPLLFFSSLLLPPPVPRFLFFTKRWIASFLLPVPTLLFALLLPSSFPLFRSHSGFFLPSTGTSFARWLWSSSGAPDSTARVWLQARVCVRERERERLSVRAWVFVCEKEGCTIQQFEPWKMLLCMLVQGCSAHSKERSTNFAHDKFTLPHPLSLTCSLHALFPPHYTFTLSLSLS